MISIEAPRAYWVSMVLAPTRCIPQLAELRDQTRLSLDSLEFARYLDERDELSFMREQYEIPGKDEGEIYFNAHALGPMPKAVPQVLAEEVESWRET